jgi:hypothetical protein
VDLWGPDARDPLETCNPLGVEIYRLEGDVLAGWESPKVAAYAGNHGRQHPTTDWAAIKRERCC